ncbi:MAG: type I methionyl aminopeptidase [Eubacteriaceae bacterium]|nr:type I methionyl aminopeptidase [Eubacteriaceae bacterium]
MIETKSEYEISLMRQACRISALALKAAGDAVRAGISTWELDEIAFGVIVSNGATPAFLGYNGFPNSICASVNDEIIHGIPSREAILKEGDIISIDVGAVYNGYVGDNANTYAVGAISDEARLLIETSKLAFYNSLEFARPGCRLHDISHAVQETSEANGFSVVREFVGHGIGKKMHEPPSIPNYGKAGTGIRLYAGMVLAIEPMINQGSAKVKINSDGWTARTADGKLSSHYEHTVAITKAGPLILTELEG